MKKKKRETHPISSSASHKNPHHRIEW
jgi:hypothetical protein